MVLNLSSLPLACVLSLFLITQINLTEAWIWSENQDDTVKGVSLDNIEDSDVELTDNKSTNVNNELDENTLEEEEDAENERNLRCSQHFNRNLYKILKSFMPANSSERNGRQDDTNPDPDELVQSMLNLELSQIIGPVLKIIGSAASANATGIDKNYMDLPLAVRYQVSDFIKFTIDLLTTT